MKNKLLKLILFSALLLTVNAYGALAENITGRVFDSQTNEPLLGASVVVKSSVTKEVTGVITDDMGRYSIKAVIGDELEVSYIGYETKSMKVTAKVMNVSLDSDAYALSDIVVVGVRMKKSDLTGATGSISAKEITSSSSTDLLSTMQGKVPGLRVALTDASPGGDMHVRVRGNNSIHHGQSPVYVIDGVVVDEGLRMVSPDEIESIEILKDASSTALYGSRASNGVIVITTKKGRLGEGRVNYRGHVTISRYQNRMKTLSAAQTMALRTDAYANGYMDRNPDADRAQYINDVVMGTNQVFSEMEMRNGLANNTANWIDHVTQTGVEQSHAIDFSGATEKGSYYLGFNYSMNEGVIKNSSYERFGARINLDRQIKPWLKVGTNTSITRGLKGKVDGAVYDVAMRGNRMQDIDTEQLYMYYQGVAQMGLYNPILSLDIRGKETHDRVLTTNYIEVNPYVENLYIRTSVSADIYNKQDYRYTPSYVGQSVRNNDQGTAWQWRGQTRYYQWDSSISYEKTFAQKHRLFGMVSSSVSQTRSNNIDLSGYGFPTDMLGAKNVGMSENRDRKSIGSNYSTHSLVSFIARVNYSYENKYMLTATVRTDGSSKFAKDNRWGSFPSFSAAWVITEENFMKGSRNWLDHLKLRAGYGVLGNQSIPSYSYMFTYDPTQIIDDTGFVPSDNRAGNPNIKWEKQKQFNIGLDGTLVDNRFSFSLDYFQMTNSDLLMNMGFWPSHGYGYQVANVGKLDNKGIEFSFNAQLIRSKNISWSIAGNIAKDKNKIKRLAGGVDVLFNGGNVQSRTGNLFVGNSLNSIWGYNVRRLAQESDMDMVNNWEYIQDDRIVRPGDMLPVDINKDNRIDTKDMMILGNTDPDFYGGFSTHFSWKNLSFDAIFTYSYGAKRLSGLYEAFMDGSATGSPAHKSMLDRWTPENTQTGVQRAFRGDGEHRFGYGNTSYGVLNASYLRLATISVAYDLSKVIRGNFFQNLTINVAANNLFTITPYKGYDPEGGEGYPLSRSFTVGLNVTF